MRLKRERFFGGWASSSAGASTTGVASSSLSRTATLEASCATSSISSKPVPVLIAWLRMISRVLFRSSSWLGAGFPRRPVLKDPPKTDKQVSKDGLAVFKGANASTARNDSSKAIKVKYFMVFVLQKWPGWRARRRSMERCFSTSVL